MLSTRNSVSPRHSLHQDRPSSLPVVAVGGDLAFRPLRIRGMAGTRRRGTATLEFALMFPLIIAVMLAILTIASVSDSKCRVLTESRRLAFRHRHQPWAATSEVEVGTLDIPAIAETGKILGPQPIQPPQGGMIGAQATAPSKVYLESMTSVASRVHGESHVLGGVWDQKEIQFRQHPRLTLSDKANFFGFTLDLEAFQELGRGGSGSNPAALVRDANGGIASLLGKFAAARKETTQELSDLRRAFNATSDPNRQVKLRDDIREKQQELSRIDSWRDQLESNPLPEMLSSQADESVSE